MTTPRGPVVPSSSTVRPLTDFHTGRPEACHNFSASADIVNYYAGCKALPGFLDALKTKGFISCGTSGAAYHRSASDAKEQQGALSRRTRRHQSL